MKNHNGNIFRSHLELFNGGSWGGIGFILANEAEGFTSFLGKTPIFKAIGGAIMGWESCLNQEIESKESFSCS